MTIENDKLYLTGEEMTSLSQVALGKEKADLVILNACLVNVYTGEIQGNQSVAVRGKWIALVSEDVSDTIDQHTTVIDAQGKTLIPGLIDGHTHLSVWMSIYEYLRHIMKGGTTTIINEIMEPFPVCGCDGVDDLMASFQGQPIKIFSTAPAMGSISTAHQGMPNDIMEKLIKRDDIVGIGESYWQAVLQDHDSFLDNFESALKHGKTVEGHSAGARGKKLCAYAAMGISSCHEPVTMEETLERLRLGIYVMAREGSIRRDLDKISQIKDENVDLRRLILTTDGISPSDLIKKGYLEYPVQKAIDYGFSPVTAVQMATLNVAEHFGLDHLIGGIAPAKIADMVIIPDPEIIQAEAVISNGKIIAQDGELCVEPRKHRYKPKSLNSVNLPRKFKADDFKIDIKGDQAVKKVHVINMVTDLVTSEIVEEVNAVGDDIPCSANRNLLKIAAVERSYHPETLFTGLIKGFGLTSGAVACSAAWDCSSIVVVGADEADMAAAVNRINELQGGLVICRQQAVVDELALPVFGLISELPAEKLAARMASINHLLKDSGVGSADPVLSLITLTGAAIPYLRICEQGLVNLKTGSALPVSAMETD